MIDFVKILVEKDEYDGSVLKKHHLLKFIGKFKESTGETFNTYTAIYNDLKFILHESDNNNPRKSS